jgi:hypothetical protein
MFSAGIGTRNPAQLRWHVRTLRCDKSHFLLSVISLVSADTWRTPPAVRGHSGSVDGNLAPRTVAAKASPRWHGVAPGLFSGYDLATTREGQKSG